jgi:hypothetical protein
MPKIPPRQDVKMDVRENADCPQIIGRYPPALEPTIIPNITQPLRFTTLV